MRGCVEVGGQGWCEGWCGRTGWRGGWTIQPFWAYLHPISVTKALVISISTLFLWQSLFYFSSLHFLSLLCSLGLRLRSSFSIRSDFNFLWNISVPPSFTLIPFLLYQVERELGKGPLITQGDNTICSRRERTMLKGQANTFSSFSLAHSLSSKRVWVLPGQGDRVVIHIHHRAMVG